MEFGVFDHLDRHDLPLARYYAERLSLIEDYDRLGIYAYHLAEHHATPLGMAPSPSVFLATVAQRTRRLRFGPMVFALPLYHPLRLAEEICMLDQLSGGRLDLGFGRGSSAVEIEYFGEDSDIPRTQRIYAESLQVILQALSTGRLRHSGEFYRFDDVVLTVEPLQKPHPPLWYGAHSPDSTERAARQGQNIISLDPPEVARALFNIYQNTWNIERPGQPLPKVGLGRFVVVAPTDAQAMERGRRAYRRWHKAFMHLFHLHNRPIKYPRPDTFDELLRAGQGVAGSPQSVADQLSAQIRGTCCNYTVCQFAFGDLSLTETRESVALFMDKVAPWLRAAA